jgi:Ca2+-dependent lipid-binding protein
LEQDNWTKDIDFGYQVSSHKKDDLNPVYGESFTWTIPSLENMVLTIKVMDDDVGSRDDKVGGCKINLEKLALTGTPINIDRVIDKNVFSNDGKIFLKISFKE